LSETVNDGTLMVNYAAAGETIARGKAVGKSAPTGQARPVIDDMTQAALRLMVNSGQIAIRVTPGSARESVLLEADATGRPRLRVAVRARPLDGEANAAVIALLAKASGLPRSSLEISRGSTGRDKMVRINHSRSRKNPQ
jgi:hypothetical protein